MQVERKEEGSWEAGLFKVVFLGTQQGITGEMMSGAVEQYLEKDIESCVYGKFRLTLVNRR